MKTSRMLLAALAVTTSTLPALAGGPMPQGTFTIGAERLMGIAHADAKDSVPGNPEQTNSVTAIMLFSNGGFVSGDSRELYAIPRVGFDYFIIDGLSLGGSLTLLHASASATEQGITRSQGSTTGYLFAPRVGYAYMFSDVVGIWPRGGFSYAHDSFDPDQGPGSSNHVLAFDIDVPFLIAPVKSFAITVGPIFDVSFAGSAGRGVTVVGPGGPTVVAAQDTDISLVLFGLSAGVVGIL